MADPATEQRSISKPAQDKAPKFPAVLVMYHPSMQSLAEHLVHRVQEQSKFLVMRTISRTVCIRVRVQGAGKGAPSYRSVELWQGIVWGRFRDGWPNIFINDVAAIAGRDGEGKLTLVLT